MRRLLTLAGTALMLAGCADEPAPEDQTQANERDVALVEQANHAPPPLVPVTPEPILLPDIERYDMLGEVCSYAPGTSLGVRVIARQADAFMKIDGKVERFAADPGGRELPRHTRSLYNSKSYALRLTLAGSAAGEPVEEPGENARPGEGDGDYEGSVTLRDSYGRVVYEGTGLAQCNG